MGESYPTRETVLFNLSYVALAFSDIAFAFA